jgi:hypothetical protein
MFTAILPHWARSKNRGWGSSSVVEHLFITFKGMVSIPNIAKKKKREKKINKKKIFIYDGQKKKM